MHDTGSRLRTSVTACSRQARGTYSPVHDTLAYQLKERAKTSASILGRRHFETEKQCLNESEILEGRSLYHKEKHLTHKLLKNSKSFISSRNGIRKGANCPAPLLKLRQVQASRRPWTARVPGEHSCADNNNIFSNTNFSFERNVGYRDALTPKPVNRCNKIILEKRYIYDNSLSVLSFTKDRLSHRPSFVKGLKESTDSRSSSAPPGIVYDTITLTGRSLSNLDKQHLYKRVHLPQHRKLSLQTPPSFYLANDVKPLIPTRVNTRANASARGATRNEKPTFKACLISEEKIKRC